jgi:hypothetical protein
VFLHKPGLQPLPQHAPVQWNMSKQPVMADPIKAGLDVAL